MVYLVPLSAAQCREVSEESGSSLFSLPKAMVRPDQGFQGVLTYCWALQCTEMVHWIVGGQ